MGVTVGEAGMSVYMAYQMALRRAIHLRAKPLGFTLSNAEALCGIPPHPGSVAVQRKVPRRAGIVSSSPSKVKGGISGTPRS